MRGSTFNYIKEILRDYYKTDEYIRQREEELRYPHRDSDLNADIKGTKASHDKEINMMITISQDKRLSRLEKNKKVVCDVLENSDSDTQVIINELYCKDKPSYTLDGLIEQKKIYSSKRTAQRLRTEFFEEVAKQLDLVY